MPVHENIYAGRHDHVDQELIAYQKEKEAEEKAKLAATVIQATLGEQTAPVEESET